MKSRAPLFLGFLAVLVLSQAFNVVLGVQAFRSAYEAAVFSDLEAAGQSLRRSLSSALEFGRPLNRIPGLQKAMKAALALEPRLTGIAVAGPDGTVLYAAGAASGAALPAPALAVLAPRAAEDKESGRVAYRDGPRSRLALPVAAEGRAAAVLDLGYDAASIDAAVRAIYLKAGAGLAAVLLPTFILIYLVFRAFRKPAPPERMRRDARLRIAAAGLVVALSQSAAALVNAQAFKESFLDLAAASVASAARQGAADLALLQERGLSLERMKNLELLLDARRESNPIIGTMEVRGGDGRLLYAAGPGAVYSVLGNAPAPAPSPAAPGGSASQKLERPGAEPGLLTVSPDSGYVDGRLRELFLDAMTVLLVTLVVSFEFLGFIVILAGKEEHGTLQAAPRDAAAEGERSLHLIRATSFVFFSAAFFPLSFLPLFMESLLPPGGLGFLAPTTWLSLPLSAFLLGVTALIPVTAVLSKRSTFRLVYLAGGSAFALGSLGAAFAGDLAALSFFRLLAGAGYGAVITNSTTLVVGLTAKRDRARGFGALSAGIAAATVCAMPVGGILVNRLGLRAGMAAAAVLAVGATLFLVFYSGTANLGKDAENSAGLRFKLSDLSAVLKSRRLAAGLFFSSLPGILADTGVFAFAFPLYMNSLNVGRADIGRVMTLYGVIALLSPLAARWAGAGGGNRRFLIAANVVVGLALPLFLVSERIWTFALVMVLMGFGLMLMDTAKEAYVAETPESAALGETRLLGFFETAEKVLGMAVPLAAGLLFSGVGFGAGIAAIGFFSLASALAFALLTRGGPGNKEAR